MMRGLRPRTPSREHGSLHPVNVYNQSIEATCDRNIVPVWGVWGDGFPHLYFAFLKK